MYDIIQNVNIDPGQIRYIKIKSHSFPVYCPGCKGEMCVKDSKRRFIKDENGQKYPFNLRRLYCHICKRLHTEIPSIVTPYCQYDNMTRERVKSGEYTAFAGDDSTIRLWRRK